MSTKSWSSEFDCDADSVPATIALRAFAVPLRRPGHAVICGARTMPSRASRIVE
jgi:hypothetical protein